MLKFLVAKWSKLEAANGLMTNPSGGNMAIDGGLGTIVPGLLVGAMLGMVGGFILCQLLRFFAMIFNRPLGGYSWVIVGTFVGALAFAIMALNVDKN